MRLFPLPFLFSLSSWCSFCLFACYIVTPSSLFLTEYLPPLFVLLLVLVLALLLLPFSFSSSSYFSQLSEDCWKKYVDFTRLKLKYQEFLAKPPGSFGSIECWELPAIIFDIFAGLGIKCLDFFILFLFFPPPRCLNTRASLASLPYTPLVQISMGLNTSKRVLRIVLPARLCAGGEGAALSARCG